MSANDQAYIWVCPNGHTSISAVSQIKCCAHCDERPKQSDRRDAAQRRLYRRQRYAAKKMAQELSEAVSKISEGAADPTTVPTRGATSA